METLLSWIRPFQTFSQLLFVGCSFFLSSTVQIATAQTAGDADAEIESALGDEEDENAAPVDLAGAEWIWSPAQEKDHVPVGDCRFRKSFDAGELNRAQIHIAADNQYALFVNGKLVGKGTDWRAMDVFDLKPHLVAGKNTIAVHVTNIDAGAAGLVARVLVEDAAGEKSEYSTDRSWRTRVVTSNGAKGGAWTETNFADADWVQAKSYGPLGETLPWGNEVVLASLGARFNVADKLFKVERIFDGEKTGSLIAMAFDHDGSMLVSQEGGPILKLTDGDGDGELDSIATYCDAISTAQGLLPLGKQVFAVGDGPGGSALYALQDDDGDGAADTPRAVIAFRGSSGEHGPHAVRLGRDGYLYVMIGDHAQADVKTSRRSPYRNPYEGDLVRPRYEDPNGHAVGVPAPGGTVVRLDTQGKVVEHFAGGIRNAYDFSFLPDGEMVAYDADMEWDLGAPWYRPTRINHVTPGAELGWRSGWAKWPEAYIDSLPAALDKGPGSPTGVEVYDHVMFPVRYHGALFAADWARGRIDVIRFKKAGATYTATAEPFVEGTPLNVTDLAVGPDGQMYFCTGGRGTAGGVYRVRYTGKIPDEVTALGRGIAKAIRQPQLDAPWAQSKIAAVRQELGDNWGVALAKIAADAQHRPAHRVRALDLMQLFGPRPSTDLLMELTGDDDRDVRVRAIMLLGVLRRSNGSDEIADRLGDLTRNPDGRTRRAACEAICRGEYAVEAGILVDRLGDPDRFVRFAARRALEQRPIESWRTEVLSSSDLPIFLNGSVGVLAARPSEDVALEIIDRCAKEIRDADFRAEPTDASARADEFVDVLRVAQLALIHGQIASPPAEQIGRALSRSEQEAISLQRDVAEVYPTRDANIDRELVRLLVYLQSPDAAEKFAMELASEELPFEEKLHIAAYASRLSAGWNPRAKLAMIEFLDAARAEESGYSVRAYVEKFSREFLENLTPEEQFQVLDAAADWPHTALSIVAIQPPKAPPAMLKRLQELDASLENRSGDAIARLRVGIVAVLGRSGDDEASAYLREVYKNDPDRRSVVAMSLTQNPEGPNWPVLIDAFKIIEGPVADEVLAALMKVDVAPEESIAYRNLLLLALRSKEPTAQAAIRLLEHWTGFEVSGDDDVTLDESLIAWRQWYAEEYPDALPADAPASSAENKWSYDELLSYLQGPDGAHGDIGRGEAAFTKAQCVQCHRHGSVGEIIGPDLTTVANRFHTKEILESIVYPSHVVSDQYASKVVVVNGRQIVGLVAPDGDRSIVVLQQDGTKKQVFKSDIDEIIDSKQSAMPDGLLNTLTLEEVADLFAYLKNQPRTAKTAPRIQPAR